MAEQIGAYAYLSARQRRMRYICIDSFIEWHFFYVRQIVISLCAKIHSRLKSKTSGKH